MTTATSTHPVISVLMSVFNGGHHLSMALESVLEQTFTDFEFIVIDDGSTDSTSEILADYASRDSRIRLVRHDRNMGLTYSLNKGLAHARGRYIARQDADDISLPERLSKQLSYFQLHPGTGLLGTWAEAIDPEGKALHTGNLPTNSTVIKWHLHFANCLVHTSVMYPLVMVRRLGFYAEDFESAQDYELWVRLSQISTVANLPQVLVQRRLGPHRISSTYADRQASSIARVIQAYSSYTLQRHVSLELASHVQRAMLGHPLGDAGSVIAVAGLVRSLYKAYLRSNRLDLAQLHLIRQDAANKLFVLAGRNLRVAPWASLRVAYWAQRMHGRLPSGESVKRIATNNWEVD